jgi:hypothetical protein
MGTVNALPLFAEPNTNWVSATSLWVTSMRSIIEATQPNPAPGLDVSFACGALRVSCFPGSPNPYSA